MYCRMWCFIKHRVGGDVLYSVARLLKQKIQKVVGS